VLEGLAGRRRVDATRATRGAGASRGEAEQIGGEVARARLATLARRMLARPESLPSPAVVAQVIIGADRTT
jgi:hypothetical protein